jgi:hypothetical protein
MRASCIVMISLALTVPTFGQRRGVSSEGFGNVPFPGSVQAVPSSTLGATVEHFSAWSSLSRPLADKQNHTPRSAAAPLIYFVPYDTGAETSAPGDPMETLGDSTSASSSGGSIAFSSNALADLSGPDRARERADLQNHVEFMSDAKANKPTIYFIAFKDRRIARALGYWMESGTMRYVTDDYNLNQASLDLIDLDLSQRLNAARGLRFDLDVLMR